MGSASLLDSSDSASAGMKKNKGRPKGLVSKANKEQITNAKDKKRSASQKNEDHAASKKRPKRAAACTDFKERSVRVSDKSSLLESRRDQFAEDEIVAIHLTEGQDDGRPNRRLTDFVVHDVNGTPQPLEMIEVNDMFISGHVLPLDETSDKEKEKRVRCEGFGRIEGWDISGYDYGTPVVWLTTDIADYDCLKPAGNYKKFYDHFFEKARACVEVYKKLSKSSGGNPDLSVDELLAGVVRSLSGSRYFCGAASIKDFVISQGEFIYKQLVGLDETSKKNDQKFMGFPALVALKEKSERRGNFVLAKAASTTGNLTIHQASGDTVSNVNQSTPSTAAEEDEDAKLARLLQEEEYWQNAKKQKKIHGSASSSNTVYIKINEDEIAKDYPLPAFYKNSEEETDEYIAIDTEEHVMVDPDELPKRMLHNWSLYNSDSRLISLELLPMRPCEDIDVTIFGSGKMTEDDGSGFCLDDDPDQSSSGSSREQDEVGLPIFFSAIKEWMIEFGSSMVFISIRTDMAWYRLGKPSKQYFSWHKPVLKTAKLARSIITLLKEQSWVSRLSFADVIRKVSEFKKDNHGYISSDLAAVERYVVVHGQIILQLFAEFPDEKIKKCAFVVGLTSKMEDRHHTKWVVNKKQIFQKNQPNLNLRATMNSMGPLVSKRKAMQATTTRLINRIWGEYYSNYSPEDLQPR